ncbi:uncharacterized protein LOC143174444 [Nomia melanderi]|uniref:uncharacterized protein LOC143174444 n=1 Tax=Nomia melanderi TaxID=2448451 RepID=UPI003FCDC469
MFTPSKSSDANFIDVTLLSTPQPKASSTVQRKSTLGSKFYNEDIHETMYKQPMISKGDITHKSDDSSLGILDNISSFLAEVSETGDLNNQNENKLDTERELARKLLQSCSNIKPTSITHGNIYVYLNVTPSALVDQGQFMSYNQTSIPNESTLPSAVNKTSSVGITL